MGGQQPLALQDALEQAAVNGGFKDNAKQAADLWRANERAKFLIPQGA